MLLKDFYLERLNNKTKVVYHIPTGTMCKVSDDIFNDLKVGCDFSENTNKFISSLKKLPVIKNTDVKPVSELINNLLFISSENCNLRCKYCFVDHGRYNKKLNTKNMNLDTYVKSVEYALKLYPKGIKNICFFGGEPLLNFDVIKEFVNIYKNEFLSKRSDIYPTTFSIITNGTLVNREIMDFVEENNFAVTLHLVWTVRKK